MDRRRKLVALFAVLTIGAIVLVVRGQPIAEAAPHAVVHPPIPSAIHACWVEYGRRSSPGGAGTAGYTHAGEWDVTVSGLVVRHPQGDLVVDVGNSSQFDGEIEGYGVLDRTWLKLFPGGSHTIASAPDTLRAAGVDPEHVTAILSHIHPDHAGGLVDLPHARVLLPREELAFATAHREDYSIHVIPAEARALDGRAAVIDFQPHPYETFDESADIFGDGSVVVVKLFGHTPGSVGVFVNESPTRRFFHVGDAVNLAEAIDRRLTKSVVMASTDVDHEAANRVIARIAQLHEAEPAIAILPAHDRVAWEKAFGTPGCATAAR